MDAAVNIRKTKSYFQFVLKHKMKTFIPNYFAKRSDGGLISFANKLAKEINILALSVSIRVNPCQIFFLAIFLTK